MWSCRISLRLAITAGTPWDAMSGRLIQADNAPRPETVPNLLENCPRNWIAATILPPDSCMTTLPKRAVKPRLDTPMAAEGHQNAMGEPSWMTAPSLPDDSCPSDSRCAWSSALLPSTHMLPQCGQSLQRRHLHSLALGKSALSGLFRRIEQRACNSRCRQWRTLSQDQ